MHKTKLFFIAATWSLLVVNVHAGDIRRVDMRDSTGTVATWATVDSSASGSVWFKFPDNKHSKLSQSGTLTIVAWFDTAAAVVGANLDTIDVTAAFEFWDTVSGQFEEVSIPASGDTLNLKTDFRWSVNHSDNKYQFSATVPYRGGMARLKLTAATQVTTSQFRFRAEAWFKDE